jgi:hypothetical protein
MLERTYGDFEYVPEDLTPEANLEFSVTPIDLTAHWPRCGLLSDLVAGYIAYAYHESQEMYKFPIYSSISMIFQELIENAAKYSHHRETIIRVRVKHFNSVVRLEVQNDATIAFGEKFEAYVERLLTSDLEEMHVQIVEDKALDRSQSGLGLVMLLKDYPIKFGAHFRRVGGEREIITVRAHYHLEGYPLDLDMNTGDF